MKSRNDRRSLVLLAGAALAAFASALDAADLAIRTDTPEATVRSLHEGLVAVAAEHGAAPLAERYRALEPLIEATHDLPYIAEFAIRRQWRELSEEERERFVDAFSRLSVMTYASRFKGVDDTSFESTGSDVLDSGRAEVRTAIARANGEQVSLDYTLQQSGERGWQIINIIADGVSDLALKRAEYSRVLATGSIDDLIRHIEEQTAQLE